MVRQSLRIKRTWKQTLSTIATHQRINKCFGFILTFKSNLKSVTRWHSIMCVQYTGKSWSSGRLYKRFLQLCLKFPIIVFLQSVHENHPHCNSVACLIWNRDVFYTTYENLLKPLFNAMIQNSSSWCHILEPHFFVWTYKRAFFSMNRRLLCIILTVGLRCHELHLL